MNIVEILNELKKTEELCSIYSDGNNTDKFSVGYVMDIDETYYVMESIDPYGKTDGLFCKIIENIVFIEKETIYLEKIMKLNKFYKQQRYPKYELQKDPLLSLLKFAQKNSKVCSFELCESSKDNMVGIINEITDEFIEIECFNDYGKNDGTAIVELGKISSVSCDSSDEKVIEILSKK